jgi:hypothetical protein
LPLNPRWSHKAQEIYLGIIAVTNGRNVIAETVADAEMEAAAVAA